jgi:hypothetical protein
VIPFSRVAMEISSSNRNSWILPLMLIAFLRIPLGGHTLLGDSQYKEL